MYKKYEMKRKLCIYFTKALKITKNRLINCTFYLRFLKLNFKMMFSAVMFSSSYRGLLAGGRENLIRKTNRRNIE